MKEGLVFLIGQKISKAPTSIRKIYLNNISLPLFVSIVLFAGVFYLHSAAASTGLVASYGFNEGTGTTTGDSSGNTNNGTIRGAAWNNSGKFGKALSFNSSAANNWVSVADSASLRLTNGMTLEAWVNPNILGNGNSSWRTVILKERSTNSLTYGMYANNNSSRPLAEAYTNSSKTAAGSASLPLNTWTHLASTYDGANVKLFVNGTQVSSTAATGNLASSTAPLRIGGNNIWSEWFGGLIDEVRIYNRALAISEIQSDMNTPVSPPDTTAPSTPTNLTKTSQTENSINLSWTASTDNAAVANYGVYKNSVLTASPTGMTYALTGLACGTTYNIGVDAVDTSGNHSSQAILTAATDACDITPPTVQLTSPAADTTVAGAVTVSASASDNKAVSGVQFKLDGVNLGAEDTSSPYSANWDTTAGANGSHALTAISRDGSNNTTTSVTVTVNVNNQSPNFVNDTLIIGLNEPTETVFASDGRMFIIERGGKVWVAQPGATAVNPTPVMILPQVWTADERGLLGIELDPNFATNGYMYLYYTNSATSKNEVSRFTIVNNVASTSSKVMIWQNTANADIWHQGGDLHFGPDGKLYISVGDHLQAATSQDLDSFNGKILRINSDGTVPTDNPFYDGTGPNKDAIWVYGLRNPFRFSIDSVSGKMYIGDVGQGTWEEVNIGVKGANYGWPICEGNCSTSGMTNPIYQYDHSGGLGASVTGGFVYRGNQFPAAYQGSYFFADYAQHWVKRIVLDANGNFVSVQNFLPIDGSIGGPYGDIVALNMSPDGSLYYVDNGPFAAPNAGSIRRIKNVNANQPPTSQISADVTTGPPPLAVSFSSAGSTDPEGQPLTYSWDFGDGANSASANPSHTYSSRGRYTVRLTTSDGTNSTPSSAITITAGNPPQATVLSPANGFTYRAGDTISFNGEGSDLEDGALASSSLSWKVVFHHNSHIHPFIDQIIGSSGSFQVPLTGHGYEDTVWYEIVLTATDSDGIQTQSSVNVYPEKTHLSFSSQPAGLVVTLDGIPHTTPFEFDTLIGINMTANVDSPQYNTTGRYDFASWSDGGTQSHQITAPATAQSYSVNFNLVSTAPQGLVAAYSFNEGNGSTLYDGSGSNNNGTLNGPIWNGSGKYGGALQYDGVNDMVNIVDANTLDLTNGMTLEAWVNPATIGGTNWSDVLFKEAASGGGGGQVYALYANNDNNRPVAQINIGGEKNAQGASILPVGTWTHLASTYDGTNLKLYINGSLASTTAVGGNIPTTNGALTLGGNRVWGEWFSGLMDNVRVYNRALTATEVQNDMNTPVQ